MSHSFRRFSAIALPATLIAVIAPIARAQNSADNGKDELPPKERLAAEVYVLRAV